MTKEPSQWFWLFTSCLTIYYLAVVATGIFLGQVIGISWAVLIIFVVTVMVSFILLKKVDKYG